MLSGPPLQTVNAKGIAESAGEKADTGVVASNAFQNWPDDLLIKLMFHRDRDVAKEAKAAFDARHADDPKLPEPAHCDECFEGCPKCQPGMFTP